MATYYVTTMHKGLSGSIIEGCGSSYNFTIDGRLSLPRACEVAREHAKKESDFKGEEYCGFKIAKGERWSCIDSAKIIL